MYDLTHRAVAKLEEAWKASVRIRELSAQIKELDTRRSQLYHEADSLRTAVIILAADGEAGDDDLQALKRAFVAWEAGRSPAEAAAEQRGPEPDRPLTDTQDSKGDRGGAVELPQVRLVDAVEEATGMLSGEFKSEAVRKVLERTHPAILHRVRKASITGALARLADVGILERVTPGGRGIEAIFRRKEGADRSLLLSKRAIGPNLDAFTEKEAGGRFTAVGATMNRDDDLIEEEVRDGSAE